VKPYLLFDKIIKNVNERSQNKTENTEMERQPADDKNAANLEIDELLYT
jgi:hypothetical protein